MPPSPSWASQCRQSTLFNRLVGSRRAIVGDEPGITRDRLYGHAEWRGRHLRIVDTGGILPEDKDFIPAEIFRQAKVALEEADAVIMVVDGRTVIGVTRYRAFPSADPFGQAYPFWRSTKRRYR